MVRIASFFVREEKECGALGRNVYSIQRFIYEKEISK